jgi:hypothetical protein
VDFEITSNFNRREFDKIAKTAIKDTVKEAQARLDRVHRTYSGRPVPEVKAAILREWQRGGDKLSDDYATKMATRISEGTRIVLKH